MLRLIKRSSLFIFVLLGLFFSTSCTAVKEYQKVYLNDPNMDLNQLKEKKFETAFQVYREGASGANGGKAGGGCGCN